MGANTKFVAIVLGSMLAVCCSFQLLRGQAAPPPAAAAGETDHHQLETTDTELFVIDTTTGRVWSRAMSPRAQASGWMRVPPRTAAEKPLANQKPYSFHRLSTSCLVA